MMAALDEMIERNDPDPLLREIDALCSKQDWQGVLTVRNRCNAATERGKTLWGVAEHAAYRLALEAPGEFAASVLDAEAGPLALGPLPEVAASTHAWEELSEFIDEGPLKGITAYECVAHGEDLSHHKDLAQHQINFEMPLRLYKWEPEYSKPEYHENEAAFPAPAIQAVTTRSIAVTEVEELDEQQSRETWRNMVSPWLTQSNGTAKIAVVNGNVDNAIVLVDHEATTLTNISTENALQLLCWAAASGGAHGRRRGLAAGRSLTWLLLADICDTELDGNEIKDAINDLQWCTWGDLDHVKGWDLKLAAHDPIDDISFAINARDSLKQ